MEELITKYINLQEEDYEDHKIDLATSDRASDNDIRYNYIEQFIYKLNELKQQIIELKQTDVETHRDDLAED